MCVYVDIRGQMTPLLEGGAGQGTHFIGHLLDQILIKRTHGEGSGGGGGGGGSDGDGGGNGGSYIIYIYR
jgi:hypothetical protein